MSCVSGADIPLRLNMDVISSPEWVKAGLTCALELFVPSSNISRVSRVHFCSSEVANMTNTSQPNIKIAELRKKTFCHSFTAPSIM